MSDHQHRNASQSVAAEAGLRAEHSAVLEQVQADADAAAEEQAYTLNPKSRAPTPWTLNPEPWTQRPEPKALNSKP